MNLNIMSNNADTLTKDKMLELLQTIYNRSTLPHVIAISEAKPKYSKTDFNPVTVQIPSYNMEPLNMKLTDKGRGMSLFSRGDLDYRPIDTKRKMTSYSMSLSNYKWKHCSWHLFTVVQTPLPKIIS